MNVALGAVSMLLALTAAQFLVHAIGWTMAARLFRRPRGPEGHFALFWFALAAALAVYLLPFQPGHPVRAVADWLMLAACFAVHRGMLLYFGRRPRDAWYAAGLVLLALAVALSLVFDSGYRWRLAGASLLVAASLAAVVAVVWRHGRRQSTWQTAALAAPLVLLAGVLVVRAAAALAAEPRRLAIDADSGAAAAFVLSVFFVGGVFNLVQIRLVLGRVMERLLAQSRLDELTGVANRRGMLAALGRAFARATRSGHPLALLMVDIDHFKDVNDRHGHAGGDAALVRVARLLVDGVRLGDTVARWGGEEFCVLLPRCDEEGALHLAERLRAAVADSGEPAVTISVGVALVEPARETPSQALVRADRALYKAKREGRDRVVVSTTQPAPLGVS
jgi:diguanylate cyclase (GGDEF)-like protein